MTYFDIPAWLTMKYFSMLLVRSARPVLYEAIVIVSIFFPCAGRCEPQSSTTFKLDDNLVRVEAAVNGVAVTSVLDSGTGAIVVERDHLDRIRAVVQGAQGDIGGGGTARQPATSIVLETVDFGPVHLIRPTSIATSLANLSTSAGFPISVLLGRDVFLDRVVEIDYPGRKINFYSLDRAPPCDFPLPISTRSGVPVVEVHIKADADGPEEALHLVVDLGTRHLALLITGPFLDSVIGRSLRDRGRVQQVGTGIGGPIDGISTVATDVAVGAIHRADVAIGLAKSLALPAGIDGTLGVPFWLSGVITFDYKKGLMCIATRPLS